MKKINLNIFSKIILFIFCLTPIIVFASDTVPTGFRTKKIAREITAHAICRSVKNNLEKEYFVPTKTLVEWQSFINNAPSDVALSLCVTAAVDTSSSGPDIYRHYYKKVDSKRFWNEEI
jgi:hypothetical protein